MSFDDEEGLSPVKAKERPPVKPAVSKGVTLKQKARPDLSALTLKIESDSKAYTQRSAAGKHRPSCRLVFSLVVGAFMLHHKDSLSW